MDELSCLDNNISCECFPSNIAETSISSECFPSPRFAYSKSDIFLSDKDGTVGTVVKAVEGRRPWNIHFLGSLVLLVLFGACGFGLIITFRSVLAVGYVKNISLSCLPQSFTGTWRVLTSA